MNLVHESPLIDSWSTSNEQIRNNHGMWREAEDAGFNRSLHTKLQRAKKFLNVK